MAAISLRLAMILSALCLAGCANIQF